GEDADARQPGREQPAHALIGGLLTGQQRDQRRLWRQPDLLKRLFDRRATAPGFLQRLGSRLVPGGFFVLINRQIDVVVSPQGRLVAADRPRRFAVARGLGSPVTPRLSR